MECESTDAQNGGWNFKLSLGSLEPSIGGAVEISSLFLFLLLLLLLLSLFLFVCCVSFVLFVVCWLVFVVCCLLFVVSYKL